MIPMISNDGMMHRVDGMIVVVAFSLLFFVVMTMLFERKRVGDDNGSSSNKNNSKQGFDSSYWKGLNVIELGAGTGALGLSVAAMGANVTLTDQAAFVFPDTAPQGSQQQSLDLLKSRSLLDLLRVNVDNNRHVWKNTNETSVGSSNNNNSNSK
mmetsp:Transcript_28579/g.78502  ORF Transcript_28579/g.78502 Transcript_28579/m.78502 type:complete len:154 (+) Transcript_28579:1874-2335(+)